MTDKEILAELKQSYERLYDIRENGCIDHCNGQMGKDLIVKLEIAKHNIEDIYYEFYKTIDKEELRVKSLEDKVDGDNVYIARNVDGDYEVGKDFESMTCEDLDYYWYDDYKFITDNLSSEDEEYTLEYINDKGDTIVREEYAKKEGLQALKGLADTYRVYGTENAYALELSNKNGEVVASAEHPKWKVEEWKI